MAGFIGSPAMNLLDARLERRDGGHEAVLGEQRIALDPELLSDRPALRSFEGREVILGIRPEALEDAEIAADAPADRRLKGQVELREALGSEIVAHVGIDAHQAETEDVRELAGALGTEPGRGAKLATETRRGRDHRALRPSFCRRGREAPSRWWSTPEVCTSSIRRRAWESTTAAEGR